jgi:predicted MPP superfamily phosphohydrolase
MGESMKKPGMIRIAALSLFVFLSGACPSWAQAKDYISLVVLSDSHLPGRLLPEKNKVLDTVNGWADVDAIAVTGDITESSGTREEYAFAKGFFSRLKKPVYPIMGNHDYIYDSGPDGKMRKGSAESRQSKLRLFQETFGLPATHYEKRFGRYLGLFISNDDLLSPYLTVMSSGTLAWLQDELQHNPGAPTMIFFHAPLEGTLQNHNEVTGRPGFIAQPADRLREILTRNPQVFLWVSGHTHLGATNASFANPKINLYEGQVMDIHNSDMDGRSYLSENDVTTTTHDTIWTNSLFLYPDRVVVKTYDHKKGAWLDKLTREIRPNPGK